jgi:hypothetical protein
MIIETIAGIVARLGTPLADDAPPTALALSNSQLGTLLTCAQRYDYRYRQGIRTPPSAAMLIGSAVDAACDAFYRARIAGAPDLSIDDFTGVALARWDNDTRDPAAVNWGSDTPGPARDMVAACARVMRLDAVPMVDPLAAQLHPRARIEAEDGLAFELHGYLDCLDKTGRVVDNKVVSPAGFAKRRDGADRDLQLGTYGLLLVINGYDLPPEYRLDCVVKGRVPRYEPIITTRTLRDLEAVRYLYVQAARAIVAGVAHPNPTGWWCSPKWCDYWGRCPMGDGGRGAPRVEVGDVEF